MSLSLEKQAKTTPSIAQVDSLIEGILHLNVSLGEHVKKGQPIFSVDTSLTKVSPFLERIRSLKI